MVIVIQFCFPPLGFFLTRTFSDGHFPIPHHFSRFAHGNKAVFGRTQFEVGFRRMARTWIQCVMVQISLHLPMPPMSIRKFKSRHFSQCESLGMCGDVVDYLWIGHWEGFLGTGSVLGSKIWQKVRMV